MDYLIFHWDWAMVIFVVLVGLGLIDLAWFQMECRREEKQACEAREGKNDGANGGSSARHP
uniref:Uncharacterized protein n=1 Tax=Streptomyces phage Scarif TaxID=3158858 RepID=A0AAU7GZS0_9CAUD